MSTELPITEFASKWLAEDQDPETRAEIEHLLKDEDHAELERRLRKRIAFGTAGLRSSMRAGYAHMNALTVLQASQGLADYVLERSDRSAPMALSIVVGYDARHNSEKFARLAAAAFITKGIRVLWFGRLVHTPMVPFAVSTFKAAAGVMVTASHNPKSDNGYKVYWSNGCQIIPPHDSGIAAAIDAVKSITSWDEHAVEHSDLVQNIYDEARSKYFEAISRLASESHGSRNGFVYTPMHGVGLPFMQEAVRILALQVDAQATPDPEFPTVPFPNPEEKGALDLATRQAEARGLSIVVSNDPDADRFAAAERLPDGSWHQFTGNQMGALLASHLIETTDKSLHDAIMLASTVSSQMLAAMARKEGFRFKETLTGFKWLGNVAQQAQSKGLVPLFAYEEAIGHMFPTVVWDKDGIAAATVFLAACQRWAKESLTPWKKLQKLYEKYGYFEDANTYLISPSSDVTEKVFVAIRTLNEGKPPTHVGARKILRWRDLTVGFDSASPDGKPNLPVDPTAQMITCELEGGIVFTARGSGTEPKIKLYIEATGASTSAEGKAAANEVLQDLIRDWFKGLRLAGT